MAYSALIQFIIFGFILLLARDYFNNTQNQDLSNKLTISDSFTIDEIKKFIYLKNKQALDLSLLNIGSERKLDSIKFVSVNNLLINSYTCDYTSHGYRLCKSKDGNFMGITPIKRKDELLGYILAKKKYNYLLSLPASHGLFIILLTVFIIFVFNSLFLLVSMKKLIGNNTKYLIRFISSHQNDKSIDISKLEIEEYKQIAHQFIDEYNQKMNLQKERLYYDARRKISEQVAHDIRSPLACLNLLLSISKTLPEKKRVLMRTSIQRITDIANVLQKKANGKESDNSSKVLGFENVMIVTQAELLVTEMRMQLVTGSNISIDLVIDKAYGLFSTIVVSEFNRVLSNIINNAIESFDSLEHNIKILISGERNSVNVFVKDDGKGIPNFILDKVGSYGFTYGKSSSKTSGNGLGVYHAKETIKSFGGTFKIESKIDIGTTVKINLPRSSPPSWFVNNIELGLFKRVLILDDDTSILSLWKDRLANYSDNKLLVKFFLEPHEFISYIDSNILDLNEDFLILIDYEFVGSTLNGLDIIENINKKSHAILVTSHFDDKDVQDKAISLGVGIIPKTIAPFVPIL